MGRDRSYQADPAAARKILNVQKARIDRSCRTKKSDQ